MHSFTSILEHTGEYGIVVEIHHPLLIATGLPGAFLGETVLFENGDRGQVFSLDKEHIYILSFSKNPCFVGSKIARENSRVTIPVGEELLGGIIDPLGRSMVHISRRKKIVDMRDINTSPPGLTARMRITDPFLTGVAIVDIMIPLGNGQKQLIIGDRKSGKTSFLLATCKNQVHEGSIVIYAAIGKKKSDIHKIEAFFKKENLLSSTLIVASSSDDSPSLIALTPYSAMTIAEYYKDLGHNVVVVMDDLSTHAQFYRQISLIAGRFPGRDSYPGDIFYTHSRLMERAGCFKSQNSRGKTSITVLPVAEIVEGDLTGYIATNLMSMTDGHIFFDSNIFYKGRRPAVNISLSVTRVGRQTQSPLLQSINSQLTSFLTLYEKVQNLAHFGAELTESVKQVLATGEVVYTLFNQQYTLIIPVQVQLIIFSMVWLKLFPDPRAELIEAARKQLMEEYREESMQQFINQLLEVNDFNSLLGRISENSERLKSLCIIKKT